MSMSEELYQVEKVIGKRKSLKKLGGVEYHVKWLGWGSDHNTWEPAQHLEACPLLVNQFEKESSHKEEKRARRKWKKEEYVNVAHNRGGQVTVEDTNCNSLSVKMSDDDVFNQDKSETNPKAKVNNNIKNVKTCWPSELSEGVPAVSKNIDLDCKGKKRFEYLKVSTESPFYMNDIALKQEVNESKSRKKGDCFQISPESPFCDEDDIKQEKPESPSKVRKNNNIAKDIKEEHQKINSGHAMKFFPVRIIGVTKDPPLTELHFYVEFRTSGDGTRQTGLVPAKEAYEDIPQMCLKFYEDRIVWNVKKEVDE